jgi:uncharacterized membrane protein
LAKTDLLLPVVVQVVVVPTQLTDLPGVQLQLVTPTTQMVEQVYQQLGTHTLMALEVVAVVAVSSVAQEVFYTRQQEMNLQALEETQVRAQL